MVVLIFFGVHPPAEIYSVSAHTEHTQSVMVAVFDEEGWVEFGTALLPSRMPTKELFKNPVVDVCMEGVERGRGVCVCNTHTHAHISEMLIIAQ